MSYYQRYRKTRLKYQNEYYHKKTGSTRRYTDHYLITFPNGKKETCSDMFALTELMGYSKTYLDKRIRNNLLVEGCKIERIYS